MAEIGMFDPLALLVTAALNPVVALVGFFMGRMSDQWQKLLIVGFVAALMGAVAIWVVNRLGLISIAGAGNAAGVFIFSFFIGTGWAGLGYALRPANAKKQNSG